MDYKLYAYEKIDDHDEYSRRCKAILYEKDDDIKCDCRWIAFALIFKIVGGVIEAALLGVGELAGGLILALPMIAAAVIVPTNANSELLDKILKFGELTNKLLECGLNRLGELLIFPLLFLILEALALYGAFANPREGAIKYIQVEKRFKIFNLEKMHGMCIKKSNSSKDVEMQPILGDATNQGPIQKPSVIDDINGLWSKT